jgi:hypothetical protein
MDIDANAQQGRLRTIVAVLVIGGIGTLAVGGYVAWKKKSAPKVVPQDTKLLKEWCKVRKEWGEKAEAMGSDIMLKSVKDAKGAKALMQKRDALGRDYGKRVEALIKNAKLYEQVKAVEEALIVEGKTRANIAIEVHNTAANLAFKDLNQLRKTRSAIKKTLQARIQSSRADADKKFNAAKSALKGCTGLYRGPFTDAGTSDSPHISWDELEMRRQSAAKKVEKQISSLEPSEQFALHVATELVRRHKKVVVSCYKKAKKKSPNISKKIALGVRLNEKGEITKFGLKAGQDNEEPFLDCLVEAKAKWKLPKPEKANEVIMLPLDFSSL